MFTKLRNSYHNASEWAHHHSAVLVLGLTMIAAAFGWQFGGNFIDSQAHAAYDPTPWISRCDTNSGSYVVDTTECYALANIYADLNGPDWVVSLSTPDVLWFSDTNIENWHNINLSGNHVDSIQMFGFLEGLGLGETIDFSGLPYLTYLWLWSSDISGIDISGNTALTNLQFRYHPNVTSLDVSNNTNLEIIDIEGNPITSLDISTLTDLISLALSTTHITTIDLSNNSALESLTWFGGSRYGYPVTAVDLSNNTNLQYLAMYGQQLTTIDLTNKPFLKYVNLAGNQIGGSFDFSSQTDLESIDFADNNVESVTFGDNSLLSNIRLQNNRLTSIDLSPISNKSVLMYLYLENNLIADLGVGFHQFTNIGLMDSMDTHDDKLNGNCMSGVNEPLLSFLNTTYENRESTQTCGRDVSETEYNTLVALYNATDGDNWANNDGWLQDNTVCDWYGVSCGGNNTYVNSIHLPTNGLNGYIPPMQGLSQLVNFHADNWNDDNLPDNILDVDLAAFADMPNLESLSIFQPQSVTGSFDDLVVTGSVGLPGNQTIEVINNLRHIQLSNPTEPFTYTPAQLAQFPMLDGVYLSSNILVGDMGPLSALTGMMYLDLSCYDTLDDCAATGSISFIDNMPNLRVLSLQSLNLYGSLPNSINTLVYLEDLQLDENYFAGPLPTLDASTSIKNIQLSMNSFSGAIPASRSSLTGLETIQIGGRNANGRLIVGSLPSSWSNLTNLKRIDISFTKITGSLPASWSSLTNLYQLKVFFNNITGQIPDAWAPFVGQSFYAFWLNNNNLDGPIPAWFEDMDQPFKIDNNCLDTNGLGQGLIDSLDTNNATWTSQANCLSNVQLTKTLSKVNPIPGEDFTLTISYNNIGQQKAPRFQINEVLDEDIQLMTSVPPETLTTVNKTLGVEGDVCYDNFLYGNSGPYYDHIAQVLLGFMGGKESVPNDATSQDIYEYAWAGFMGDGGATLADAAAMIGDPNLTTGGAITTILCTFLNGGEITPEGISATYQNIGVDCFPAFGVDYRSYDDQCGFGGEEGYRRERGDLLPGATGSIVLNLRLMPNLTLGSQHDTTTYLVLDGENLSNNTIPTSITVGGGTPPVNPASPSTGPSGGNPPALQTDDCSNYTPPVDSSSSYYDAECEAELEKKEEHKAPDEIPFDKKQFLPSLEDIQKEVAKLPKGISVDLEQIEAYLMAKKIGMTTMPDFMAFQPGVEITRAAAAKYFVEYREKVLGEKADESRRSMCSNFNDIDTLKGEDLYEFVVRACMHKLMGLEQGVSILASFRPDDNLPRSEGATMVSRLLYGTTYDNTDDQYTTRYEGHIQKLIKEKIITDGNPDLQEKRVYPLLMFLRWIKG